MNKGGRYNQFLIYLIIIRFAWLQQKIFKHESLQEHFDEVENCKNNLWYSRLCLNIFQVDVCQPDDGAILEVAYIIWLSQGLN